MELEICLNPSILWLDTIVYYKKLMIYIFNLTQFDFFLSKMSLVDVVAPINWQKVGHKKKFN